MAEAIFDTYAKDGTISPDSIIKWFKDSSIFGAETGLLENEVSELLSRMILVSDYTYESMPSSIEEKNWATTQQKLLVTILLNGGLQKSHLAQMYPNKDKIFISDLITDLMCCNQVVVFQKGVFHVEQCCEQFSKQNKKAPFHAELLSILSAAWPKGITSSKLVQKVGLKIEEYTDAALFLCFLVKEQAIHQTPSGLFQLTSIEKGQKFTQLVSLSGPKVSIEFVGIHGFDGFLHFTETLLIGKPKDLKEVLSKLAVRDMSNVLNDAVA